MRVVKKRDWKLSANDGCVNVLSTCKKTSSYLRKILLLSLPVAAE